jgi:hypothetical protein
MIPANSNDVAGKSAKRKSIPRLKMKAVRSDARAALAKARLTLKAIRDEAPATPAKAKSAKRPRLRLKDPREAPSARGRKAKAAVATIAPIAPVPIAEALPTAQPAMPEAKPQRGFDVLHVLTISVAVVLAVIAAYFSVSGMTRIFPGAELAVIVMTATMEAGKLAGAAWLSRHWSLMAFGLRTVLSALVVILACINAVGVFGQLSAAHLNPHVTAVTANETEAANQGAKIDAQQRLLADLTRRISQIDTAIEEATKRGRSSSAMDLAKEQRRNRAELVQQRAKEESTLIELRTAQARTTGEQQKAAADVGVLQYAAALFGVDREQMIQLLILAMVLSCDPLSITLVVATASRKQAKALAG